MTDQIRRTWHDQHLEHRTLGQRVADATARVLGSWPFIIGQSVLLAMWVALNIAVWAFRWDPYPFILLNLLFSVQAAYSAPILMMSQNRQAERDRYQAQSDYDTNVKAEDEIEDMQDHLHTIEATLARIEAALPRIAS
jgi:uncharacterized membrane protein